MSGNVPNLVNSVDILAVRRVKQGIETAKLGGSVQSNPQCSVQLLVLHNDMLICDSKIIKTRVSSWNQLEKC